MTEGAQRVNIVGSGRTIIKLVMGFMVGSAYFVVLTSVGIWLPLSDDRRNMAQASVQATISERSWSCQSARRWDEACVVHGITTISQVYCGHPASNLRVNLLTIIVQGNIRAAKLL